MNLFIDYFFNKSSLSYSQNSNSLSYLPLNQRIQSLLSSLNLQGISDRLTIEIKIRNLNKVIENCRSVIKDNQCHLIEIQGIHRAERKMILIAYLIKFFYSWYYQKEIKSKNQENLSLDQSILCCEQQKKEWENKLHQQIHYEATDPQMIERLTCLAQTPFKRIDVEDFPFIFASYAKIQEYLELGHFLPEIPKDNLIEIYKEQVQPLMQKTKTFLAERLLAITKSAAERGKAIRIGIQASISLIKDEKIIQRNVKSSQYVCSLPQYGIIYKKIWRKRTLDEESRFRDLFPFFACQGYVENFLLQRLIPQRWGITIEKEVNFKDILDQSSMQRGYYMHDLNLKLKLKNKIMAGLSPLDQAIFKSFCAPFLPGLNIFFIPEFKDQKSKELYEKCEGTLWYYYKPNLENKNLPNIIKFKDLQTLILNEEKFYSIEPILKNLQLESIDINQVLNLNWKLVLPSEVLYQSNQEVIEPLEHIQAKPFLFSMVTLNEILKTPRLADIILNQLSLNKEFEWLAVLTGGEFQLQDFHAENIGLVPQLEEQDDKWNQMTFSYCLGPMDFRQLNNHYHKKYISLTTLIKYKMSASSPEIRGEVSEFFEIILLNIEELSSEQQNEFQHTQFIYDIQTNLRDLRLYFLQGLLSPETIITYKEHELEISKPLAELSNIVNVLAKTKWNLALFDVDPSFEEANDIKIQEIIYYNKNNEKKSFLGTLIPIRSALLEIDWKDKPLDSEIIARLENSDLWNNQVENWINRKYVPIRWRLSQQSQQQLDKQLKLVLEKPEYTLNYLRIKNIDATIKDIQEQFAQDLSSGSEYVKIWEFLERELSYVMALPGDTLEKIARRYNQDLSQLIELNPQQPLLPKEKIRIKYDLKSADSLQRRMRIARQLFPNLTWRQRDALFERQKRRKEYLQNYKTLKKLKEEPQDFLAKLKMFIQAETSPLSTRQREDYLARINRHHSFQWQEEVDNLWEEITSICTPTYFNLMKAMYPLLADVYELNEALVGKKEAGARIGYYAYPIEETIKAIKKQRVHTDPLYQLSLSVEKKIKSIKNPIFFGIWEIKKPFSWMLEETKKSAETSLSI